MNYYFLVASLPHISIGEMPAISFDEFAGLCSEHLTNSDMVTLNTILNNNEASSSHPFMKAWNEKETLFRNAISRIRASQLNREDSDFTRPAASFDSYVEKAAIEALSESNPLEKELSLDKHRWQQLEELEGFGMFTIKSILTYALKLKIAERWSKLDREKAKITAEELVNKNPEHVE